MQQIEELYSLLVPLNQARLIVPRACVAEVIRYSPAEATQREGPAWFRGFVSWNELTVPVVCFEDLCGLEAAEPGGRTRVAIFSALSGQLESSYFGILTEGFPQLVRVNREVMEADDRQEWPDDGPVICQIRMINEHPLIPDLEMIERVTQKYLGSIESGK